MTNSVLATLTTSQLIQVLLDNGYSDLRITDSHFRMWTENGQAQYQVTYRDEDDESGTGLGTGYIYVWVAGNRIRADF